MAVKSADDVRAEFRRKGVSIAQWSIANGLSVLIVYQLLGGRRPGLRGESHRAAILLGLKEGEIVEPDQVRTAMSQVKSRAAA